MFGDEPDLFRHSVLRSITVSFPPMLRSTWHSGDVSPGTGAGIKTTMHKSLMIDYRDTCASYIESCRETSILLTWITENSIHSAEKANFHLNKWFRLKFYVVSTNNEGEGWVKRNLIFLTVRPTCLAPEQSQALAVHEKLAAVFCPPSASGLLKHRLLATVIQHITAGSASYKATQRASKIQIHCF